MRASSLLLAAALLLAVPLDAQMPVEPGEPVRLRAAGHDGVFTFVAMDGDSLTIRGRDGGPPLVVPLASVRSLSVARGREPARRHALRGAGYGALIGVGTGLLVGSLADDDCFGCPSRNEYLLIGGSAFGVAGGVSGAAIGALTRPRRWVEVPLPPAAPTGVAVGVRLAL